MSDRSLTDGALGRSLTDDELDLLNDALQASSGQPPILDVASFIRANPERIADLEYLIADPRLLVRRGNKLRFMFSALAVLRARPSATHKSIWRELTAVYDYFRDCYLSRGDTVLAIKEVSGATDLEPDVVRANVMLLRDVGLPDGWSCRNELPSDAIALTETQLIELESLEHLANRWSDIVNPGLPLPDKDNAHAARELSAQVNEWVLGAALRALATHRKECLWGESFAGRKIARLLADDPMAYFQSTKPPLGESQMAKLCNKYLKPKDQFKN